MLLLLALAIPVALTLLLSNRQVQAFAARKATEYLSGYTGAEMRIGSLSYSLFSDLTLKGIYVSDLHGDSLASINKIHTDVSILPIIFENKIRVKYLDIDSVDFKLESDSSGVLNLQFLIDAFTPDSIIEMPDLSFELRSCDITHATFSYTDTGGKKNKVGKLDPGNIEVRDIKTSFSIIHASKDSVALSIDSLSAYEKSGLRLQNFSLRGSLGKQGIELDEMDLKLPGSLISIDRLYMKYDSAAVIRTVEDLMYKARIGYVMNPSYIDWKDISCIVPQVAGLRNKAYVSAEAEMYNNSLNLKELRLKYGTGFNVECNASISDPLHVGNSFIYANVDKLHCSRREFENIFEDLGLEQIGVPETIYNLGDLDFNGNITGFVSNLVAYGQLHRHNVGHRHNKTRTCIQRPPKHGRVQSRRIASVEQLGQTFVGHKRGRQQEKGPQPCGKIVGCRQINPIQRLRLPQHDSQRRLRRAIRRAGFVIQRFKRQREHRHKRHFRFV